MNTANNCPNGTDLTNNLESWGMDPVEAGTADDFYLTADMDELAEMARMTSLPAVVAGAKAELAQRDLDGRISLPELPVAPHKLTASATRLLRNIASGNNRVFSGIEGLPYGWKQLVRYNLVGRELDGRDGSNDKAFLTLEGRLVASALFAFAD